jgi:hypothetical protein
LPGANSSVLCISVSDEEKSLITLITTENVFLRHWQSSYISQEFVPCKLFLRDLIFEDKARQIPHRKALKGAALGVGIGLRPVTIISDDHK